MDRHIPINCIVVALCCVLGSERSDAQVQRSVTLADFRSLKSVDWHMELSPDGQTLAYVSGGEVWLVPTTGNATPRNVAVGSQPRWSPDRKWLAFYSTRSGSLQLWLLEVRTGETRQLTYLVGGISPDARLRFSGWIGDPLRYGWSPDGTKLVFTSQKEATTGPPTPASLSPSSNIGQGDYTPIILTATTPAAWTLSGLFRYEPQGPRFVDGRFTTTGENTDASRRAQLVNQLFVVEVATGDTRQITNDDGNYFNPDWSPDGKMIVCASTDGKTPAIAHTTDVYLIDPAQGTRSRLTSGDGIKRLPYWSPDGRWIAYASSSAGMQSVFVIARTGGAAVNITAHLDRTVQMYYWSADSESVVVSINDGVSRPLVRVRRTAPGAVETLTPRNAVHWPATSARSGALAWQLNDGAHVGRLYSSSSLGQNVLIHDLNPQMKDWLLGDQEVVRWRNTSGEDVEGILIKPVGFKAGHRYPTIVDPYSSMTNSFMAISMMGNQTYASRGYAVFFPNARAPHIVPNLLKNIAYSAQGRGSAGVEVLVDDVLTGVDTLVKMGVADKDRLGLIGFSNGGGSVIQLVTRSDRFKCAVSASGAAVDWSMAFLLNSDESFYPKLLGNVAPWDNPGEYAAISPIYRLDRVRVPILLAVGDREPNGFLFPMIEMYNGLRYLKRDVTLLRYPDQGHGFTGAALDDYVGRVNAFLDQCLQVPVRHE